MQILIAARPDDRIIKIINDIRYEYDHELLKDIPPVIPLVGPLNSRVNTNRLHKHIEYTMSFHKAIKLELSKVICNTNEEDYTKKIILTYKLNKKLLKLRYDLFQTALFGPLPEEDYYDFTFYTELINNGLEAVEEDDLIVEILNKYPLKKYDFFIRELSMLVKSRDGRWELSYDYPF